MAGSLVLERDGVASETGQSTCTDSQIDLTLMIVETVLLRLWLLSAAAWNTSLSLLPSPSSRNAPSLVLTLFPPGSCTSLPLLKLNPPGLCVIVVVAAVVVVVSGAGFAVVAASGGVGFGWIE